MQKQKIKYLLIVFLFISGTTFAQFYSFGRNKVQYEKFDWKVLKTEHFDIYYYDEFSEIAEIGAKYAEDSYDVLKVKFNHIITRRIPLIFYNTHIHFQQTNITPGFIPEGVGGFFEFMKGRVVIPYIGSLGQFHHVIRHELVHVFMTDKVYNVLKTHRVTTNKLPPLWFVEGLAEFWSTEWDTQAEMVMRDAVLNNMFFNLKNIYKIYGSFLMYKEGQNFLIFLKEHYGEDKILLLMENMWRFKSFEENIEFTLGESIENIDQKWTYQLKKEYFPLYEEKTPYYVNTKKLTDSGFNVAPAYYNNNGGKEIYFVGNRTGYTSVYKLELTGENKTAEPELIIQGEKEKIFEAFHLSQAAVDVSDSGELVFVSKVGATDALHIYSIEKEKIIKTIRYDFLISIKKPNFSYDGNKIVFNATDRKGFSDLFIYDRSQDEVLRLTNDYYNDIDPVFNNETGTVVFASDRTEGIFSRKYNLFNYDLNSGAIDYITYANADFSHPQFSPDSNELYFNSDLDGTNNIWKLELDAGGSPIGMTQSTRFITSVFGFTFIDENKIVASGFEKFSFQFYRMDLDEVPDSVQQYASFNFNNIGEQWSAPRLAVKSNKDRIKYEPKYTLDYAVSQVATDPVYGSRGGAVLSLSDMLGDDRYFLLLYNTAEIRSDILDNFNLMFTKLNTKYRTNFAYGIFHFSGRRYDLRESDEFFYERSYGGFLNLIYPISTFKRIEVGTSITNSDKAVIENLFSRKALLISNSISFVHDNSLWGPTGPVDGSRFRFLLGYTSDVKFSNVNYYSVIADYRHYLRLSFRSTLAFRGALFYNDGKEARRYFAGGSWDLRGWNRWTIRGEKLWLSSVELRFPLIDGIGVKFPFFGLGFSGIRGALFFDAGGAWDEEYRETLGSVGFGFRWSFFNAITFRYDIGKKIEDDFSRFQPKLFYQFFFGWDF